MHRDLRLAGLLAPLDCPHHLRYEDQSPFREGICVDAPHWAHDQALCWVNVGLRDPIGCFVKSTNDHIGRNVPKGARVTVKMPRSGKQQGKVTQFFRRSVLIIIIRRTRLSSRPRGGKGDILGIHCSSVRLARECHRKKWME